jgi:HEAT repeat protein
MKRQFKFQVVVAALVVVLACGAVVANATVGVTPEKVLDKDGLKLVASLKHENLEVRAKAAEKLGEKCCKEAVTALVDMMKNDTNSGARIVAANALAKIKDYSVITTMREQATSDASKTVRYALNAIADQMEKEKSKANS